MHFSDAGIGGFGSDKAWQLGLVQLGSHWAAGGVSTFCACHIHLYCFACLYALTKINNTIVNYRIFQFLYNYKLLWLVKI